MDIAIVGGGITGLVAARELSGKGHSVTLFESQEQLGGLAAGFTFKGTSLEKTYHHVFRTDSHLIDLANELGIGNELLWFRSSVAISVNGTIHPFTSAWDLLNFSPLPLADRVRLGMVALLLQWTKQWKRFVAVPAHVWMRRWCGRRAYEVVWEPLLRGKFHTHYSNISMAWLWARIHTRAHSRSCIGEQLGYFHGGFTVLIDALSATLQRNGVNIVTSMPVCAVRRSVIGTKVHVQTAASTQEFDRVICTIPSHIFANFIEGNANVPRNYLQQLRKIAYLDAICMVFSSRQVLSPHYWVNVTEPDVPFLGCIQHTNLVNPSWYGGEHIYYVGTYLPNNHPLISMDADSVKQTFFRGIFKLFPHFETASVSEAYVHRFPNAQHVVDCDYVHTVLPYETPLPNVYLANFSQIFPEDRGTNFAVREGKRVAQFLEAL